MAAFRRGLHRRDDEVGAHAVGDVGLLAVDNPAAVHPLGLRAQRGHVRAGVRLGDREGAYLLAPDGGHEVALLVLVGAELPDRGRGDVDVGADPRRGAARADPRHLLDEHRLVQVVAALAAQLGGILQAEQTLRGQLWEYLVREPFVALPLLRMRRQLAVEKTTNRRAQVLMLLGEWGSRGHIKTVKFTMV